MARTLWIGVALALSVAAEANGLFMLASPARWYFSVPGVTDSGPFNQHFVPDIGLIFLLIGTAFPGGGDAAPLPHRPVVGVHLVAVGPRSLSLLGSRGRHL